MNGFAFEPADRWGFAAPSDDVTPGWSAVGIGVEGDVVDVDGANPWARSKRWRPLHKWIVVAHPSYPNQRDRADVYELTSGDGRVITFAAAELSPSVWGFFIPRAAKSPGSATGLPVSR